MKRFLLFATLGYLTVLGVILYGLFAARASAKANLSTAESQRAWDEWRKNVERQEEKQQSVRRSIPKSTEPPTRVLLRDHFGICAVAAMTMSSALYWTIALLLRGALTNSRFPEVHWEPPRTRDRVN